MRKKTTKLFFWRSIRASYGIAMCAGTLPFYFLAYHSENALPFKQLLLLFPLLTIFFIFHKSSTVSFGTQKHFRLPTYIRLTLTLQLMTFITLFGIYFSIASYFSLPMQLDTDQALITGLLPWSIYALAAMIGAYYYYTQQLPSHIMFGLANFPNSYLTAFIRRASYIILTITNQLAQALLFISVILFVVALVCQQNNLLTLHGLHLSTIIISIIYLSMLVTKESREFIFMLIQHRIQLGSYLTLSALFIFVPLLITTTSVNSFHNIIPFHLPIYSPLVITKTIALLFCLSLGILITPTIAGIIVYLNKGYNIRMLLLSNMLLPFVLTIILLSKPTLLNYTHYCAWLLPGVMAVVWYMLRNQQTNKWYLTGNLAIPRQQNLLKTTPLRKFAHQSFAIFISLTIIFICLGPSIIFIIIIGLCPVVCVLVGWNALTYCARRL